jgi:type II secretory pathway pseudopilin PulG
MIRLNSRIRKAFQGSSRGVTLVEIMIAIAFFGIIFIAFLGSLSTASRVLIIADERATAESLARSQMEYVKNQASLPSPGELPIPSEYEQASYRAVLLPPVSLKTGLQEITIEIYHDDEPLDDEPLVTLVGYKLFI